MAPPELAADAPVLNVVEPVFISVLILFGVELQRVFHHRREGDVGKVLHLQEPLHTQARLHSGVAVAFGVAHLVFVVFHMVEQTGAI